MDFLPPPTKDNGQPLQRVSASANWISKAFVLFSNNLVERLVEIIHPLAEKIDRLEQKENTNLLSGGVYQEYTGTSLDGAKEHSLKLKKQIEDLERKTQISKELKEKVDNYLRAEMGFLIYEEKRVAPQIGGDTTLYKLLLNMHTEDGDDDERDTSPVVALPPNKD